MLSNTLFISSLIATALAAAGPMADPMPHQLAKMSFNQAFGIVGRQDSGYAPQQYQCGSGDTCQEACGADTEECPSTDGDLHCFTPATQKCCRADGLGNACRDGYFCTSNSQGTWCCPDGSSLTDCAALYGVSSLTSEVATATAPPVSDVTSAGFSDSTTASGVTNTPPANTFTDAIVTTYPTKTTVSGAPSYTASSNGTVTTADIPVQVTGAANHLARGALPALAVAAGAVLVL